MPDDIDGFLKAANILAKTHRFDDDLIPSRSDVWRNVRFLEMTVLPAAASKTANLAAIDSNPEGYGFETVMGSHHAFKVVNDHRQARRPTLNVKFGFISANVSRVEKLEFLQII